MPGDGDEALARLTPPGPGAPAYRQIEEQLLDLIADGSLRPGERLVPERDLASRLGVSRMTLRQALDALVRHGYLVRAGGRGTFVAAPKVEQDLRVLRTYPDELRGQGLVARTAILERCEEPAGPRVAAALALAPGAPVLRLERLRSAGADPLVLETSWLPLARVPGVAAAPLDGSLWDALALLGQRVVRADERLEPIIADPDEAERLGVVVGAPLMRVERVAFTAAGLAVEHAVGRFRGDRARFVVAVAVAHEPGGAASGARVQPMPDNSRP